MSLKQYQFIVYSLQIVKPVYIQPLTFLSTVDKLAA
jgi:hypothetical protein